MARPLRPNPANKNLSIDTKFVTFNGVEYRKIPTYPYFYHRVPKNALHRAVWEHFMGSIPDGCDIHHVDEDTENNDIDNLELLTKAEHSDKHLKRNEPVEKGCPSCGESFTCSRKRWVGHEDIRKTFCSLKCFAAGAPPRDFVCAECGVQFTTVSRAETVQFCSNSCQCRNRHRRGYPERTCVGCEGVFKPKGRTTRYCSSSCVPHAKKA